LRLPGTYAPSGVGVARIDWCGTIFDVMRLADWFAERSVRGMLARAAGGWVCVGLPLIAARVWWSVAAALAVFVVTLTLYVAMAVRYMRRQPGRS
jgi:hypothetical protein